ncbi:capsular polysaccharide synthesis protein [Limosilactobacillus reuteri]|uniref:capsular polysaccharide synthesis protein n=1 Tax=Limosilactobacillus reuteri TaxID=1598 RepID=UPI00232F8FC1|nr:capsular polysaccharide synthesis protein [Limosilactobacillus reuteri]
MNIKYNDKLFFFSKGLQRLPISNNLKKVFNDKRHNTVKTYLNKDFNDSYERTNLKLQSITNDGPIWIFWWQGEEQMPALVRRCYNSVKEHSGKHKVILINKDNFNNYTDISPIIMDKLKKKIISLTHFSDIVRFNLLKNHGGLWLDATVLVVKNINNKYYNTLFTCSGYEDYSHFFITKGNWCGFIMGGCASNPLFNFMDTFFKIYWNNHNKLVDYFLIDYGLNYAWEKNIGDFKYYTNFYKGKNNRNLFKLQPLLSSNFNKSQWNFLLRNTDMFKLTYKRKFNGNENTYYKALIIDGRNVNE